MKSKKFIAALCALAVVVSSAGGLPFGGLRLFDTAIVASADVSISGTNIYVFDSASGTVSSDMTCTRFNVFDSSTLTINQGVTVTLNNPGRNFVFHDNSKIELHGTLAGSAGSDGRWIRSYINVYLSDGAKYTVTGLTCRNGDNYLVYYGYDAATDGNGTVSVKNGSTDVTSTSKGYKTTSYTFTATPSDGYKFVNWTKGAGGEVLGTDASINVTCEQNGQYQVYANFEKAAAKTDISTATVNLAADNSVESIKVGDDTITDLSGFDITYGTDESHTATAVPTEAGTYYAYVTPKDTNTAYTGTAKSAAFTVAPAAIDPTYTITIPATVNLKSTDPVNITASDVTLNEGQKIVVTLDGASNTASGSEFSAKDKSGESVVNYSIKAGNTDVAVGDTVAEFETKTGEQYATLTFTKDADSTPTFAGTHTETLTFGVAVEDAVTAPTLAGVTLTDGMIIEPHCNVGGGDNWVQFKYVAADDKFVPNFNTYNDVYSKSGGPIMQQLADQWAYSTFEYHETPNGNFYLTQTGNSVHLRADDGIDMNVIDLQLDFDNMTYTQSYKQWYRTISGSFTSIKIGDTTINASQMTAN